MFMERRGIMGKKGRKYMQAGEQESKHWI